jgi:hypothetical protein
MTNRQKVLSKHPRACLRFRHIQGLCNREWYQVWSEQIGDNGIILGEGLTPISAWKDAKNSLLLNEK